MNRRCIGGLLAVALASSTPTQSPATATVVAVGVTVRDLEASVRFYTEVLHFAVVQRSETHGAEEERLRGVFGLHTATAVLRLGGETIELTEFLAPGGRALPEDSRSNDRWFQHVAIVVRDMDAAYATLRAKRVRHASPVPQTLPQWNVQAAGIRAFYFQDPDGHPLELLQFPPGKGDPKWHAPGDALFLGIDHTAIVVADTAASLRFWRDELGLRVVGQSNNHGEEQERLNNVFGAHLAITTLRGSAGPGVELLEYLTPRTGRAMPPDTAANDLWQWVVTVRAPGGQPASTAGSRVSASPIVRDGAPHLLWADPDGHRVLRIGARAE